MSPSDLDVAIDGARAGAAVVGTAFGSVVEAEWKSDANPVTAVDREAEAAVVEVIKRFRPDDLVLAEEGGGSGWDRDRVWIVDPLDGTVNFLHRIPQIAVSVALWIEGSPEVGVVYDVVRNEEFAAARGGGAFLNHKPISVSPQPALDASLIATGFAYDHDVHGRRYAEVLGEVLVRVRGIRRIGSAALDLAWVSCGRYEGYWETGTQPWDAAAGVLLVSEAGGKVSNLDRAPHRLDDATIVATNSQIHDALIDALLST